MLLTAKREDKELIKQHGQKKAFLKGGNSSCRQHVRKHYELYKTRCEEAGIEVDHWAMPRKDWEAMQNKTKNPKTGGKGEQQGTLDGAFGKITGPQGFTRDGILHTVAQFVACDDQVRCP
jgi:hypothetical protein